MVRIMQPRQGHAAGQDVHQFTPALSKRICSLRCRSVHLWPVVAPPPLLWHRRSILALRTVHSRIPGAPAENIHSLRDGLFGAGAGDACHRMGSGQHLLGTLRWPVGWQAAHWSSTGARFTPVVSMKALQEGLPAECIAQHAKRTRQARRSGDGAGGELEGVGPRRHQQRVRPSSGGHRCGAAFQAQAEAVLGSASSPA